MCLIQGSENYFSQNWSWSCEYICQFHYTWYPFDTQVCHILNHINGNIKLVAKKIKYTGNQDLGKYYLKEMKYCENGHGDPSNLFMEFILNRSLTGNLITIFLPSGMLLLISQISTAFSSTFLDLVIEVNTTVLLVLSTMQDINQKDQY